MTFADSSLVKGFADKTDWPNATDINIKRSCFTPTPYASAMAG